ncbi:hypothetical protein RhiirA4_412894, partial [Rhizophagus irregularis]
MNTGIADKIPKQKQRDMYSEEIYEVSFSWAQNELVENNRIFQCGTVICTFTTDSGEFING